MSVPSMSTTAMADSVTLNEVPAIPVPQPDSLNLPSTPRFPVSCTGVNLSPLGGAFAECGRIDKTLHLLAVVDPVDDTYRRRMNRQLTVQESRHRLARAICHGKHALALFC